MHVTAQPTIFFFCELWSTQKFGERSVNGNQNQQITQTSYYSNKFYVVRHLS